MAKAKLPAKRARPQEQEEDEGEREIRARSDCLASRERWEREFRVKFWTEVQRRERVKEHWEMEAMRDEDGQAQVLQRDACTAVYNMNFTLHMNEGQGEDDLETRVRNVNRKLISMRDQSSCLPMISGIRMLSFVSQT